MRSRGSHVVACLLLMWGCHAQADDWVSFDQVRQRYRETKDPTRVSHLYRRCAALQLNAAALLARQKQIKASEDYENLARHYMLLSESVDLSVDEKRGIKSSKTMETVELSVRHMAEQYDARMKANRKQRGDAIAGDAVLEQELAECMQPESFVKRLGQ